MRCCTIVIIFSPLLCVLLLLTSPDVFPKGDIAESQVLQGTACTQMAVGWAPCWGGSNKPESGRNALEVRKGILWVLMSMDGNGHNDKDEACWKKKKQLYKITVCILGWIRRVLNVHYILEVIGETLRTISWDFTLVSNVRICKGMSIIVPQPEKTLKNIHMHACMYVRMYLCMHVCVCVCFIYSNPSLYCGSLILPSVHCRFFWLILCKFILWTAQYISWVSAAYL